jgi:hypothetical protein
MSRTRKSKEVGEDVAINDIRNKVREELIKRYGSVAEFLDSPRGKELGGKKIRPYLYETGALNFDVINELCKYLGIGELTRKIVVTRSYTYKLIPNKTTTEKTA